MQFKCSADQHEIWTLTRRGNTSLLELIRSALWMNWKPAIYFPNSLNINLPRVEQNWAICQTPVHHASLILSLFSVVCICVFISIFTHTEHAGTSSQGTELRQECFWWQLAFWAWGQWLWLDKAHIVFFVTSSRVCFFTVGTPTAVMVCNSLLQALSFGGRGTLDPL